MQRGGKKEKEIWINEKMHMPITSGIFYCCDNKSISVSAFNKPWGILSGMCLEIGNKNIPPFRDRAFVNALTSINTLTEKTFNIWDKSLLEYKRPSKGRYRQLPSASK